MKNSYRVQSNPETAHNGNLMAVKNKEELLGMLGFCEPLFSTMECSQTNEEEEVSVPQESSQYQHLPCGYPEAETRENSLTQNVG